jgi:FkbM family methyltransferase
MSITTDLKRAVHPFLKTLLADFVYETRFGSLKIKRKWGTGSWNRVMHRLSSEEVFLTSLDLRGKTVYDIGGFIGLLTVAFAKAVGPTGQVIVFEPNTDNASQIRENLRLNQVQNVKLFELGIADQQRKDQVFFVSKYLTATGSLDQQIQSKIINEGHFRKLRIEVDTLDNIVKTHGLDKPDFIKIDIEGMEYQALLGMRGILEHCSPQIHIENHGADSRSKQENIDRIVGFLQHYGYSIWHVETQQTIQPGNSALAREGHIFCSRAQIWLSQEIADHGSELFKAMHAAG